MAGFAFLHAANLHIDSPLVGLDRYDGAPVDEIRGATRRAFTNLVTLAIREGVRFVVLAGDVFDGDWRDFNTGFFLNRELSRLAEARIRVLLAHGNHDAAATMTRSLSMPDNTHVFSHESPETVRFDELGVVLHGQSFAEQRVTANLARAYPEAARGAFNVGVLHTALDGRAGHDAYAPCTLTDLAAKGYAYWALGHVHKREEVARTPWVVFPGNIQGRHAREVGPKGCTLVTVSEGRVTGVRHEPLDVVRWSLVTLDVTGASSPPEVVERLAVRIAEEVEAAGGRLVAARVVATGTMTSGALLAEPHRWRVELLSKLASMVGPRVWVEKLRFDLSSNVPAGDAASAAMPENMALFERVLRDVASRDEPEPPEFVRALASKLAGSAPVDDDSPFSPAALERARSEARELLRLRLDKARILRR